MNENALLTRVSLLSILLFSIHLADDIVRGMEPGTATNLQVVPTFVLWLYGTLVVAERRSGQVIMLLGSLFAMLPAVAHMRGAGVGGALAKTDGAFRSSGRSSPSPRRAFSFVLAVRALRTPRP